MNGRFWFNWRQIWWRKPGKPEDKACVFPFWICLLYRVFTDFICLSRHPFVYTSPDHRRSIGSSLAIYCCNHSLSFFIMKLKFAAKMVVVFASYTSGVLLVPLAVDVGWKLVGVCLTSVDMGVGEILSMSANYHRVTIAVYESGTGLGYITASVYYTGQ